MYIYLYEGGIYLKNELAPVIQRIQLLRSIGVSQTIEEVQAPKLFRKLYGL